MRNTKWENKCCKKTIKYWHQTSTAGENSKIDTSLIWFKGTFSCRRVEEVGQITVYSNSFLMSCVQIFSLP